MREEAYQIQDYVHDEVVAFAGAMNPKGELACEDEMANIWFQEKIRRVRLHDRQRT